jgi:hypothetical protein
MSEISKKKSTRASKKEMYSKEQIERRYKQGLKQTLEKILGKFEADSHSNIVFHGILSKNTISSDYYGQLMDFFEEKIDSCSTIILGKEFNLKSKIQKTYVSFFENLKNVIKFMRTSSQDDNDIYKMSRYITVILYIFYRYLFVTRSNILDLYSSTQRRRIPSPNPFQELDTFIKEISKKLPGFIRHRSITQSLKNDMDKLIKKIQNLLLTTLSDAKHDDVLSRPEIIQFMTTIASFVDLLDNHVPMIYPSMDQINLMAMSTHESSFHRVNFFLTAKIYHDIEKSINDLFDAWNNIIPLFDQLALTTQEQFMILTFMTRFKKIIGYLEIDKSLFF